MSGIKHDQKKPRLELITPEFELQLGDVLAFGAEKYGTDNWYRGMAWRRIIGAAKRHMAAFEMGEDQDSESGLPHLAHASACLMFLSTYQARGIGEDDRLKFSNAPASFRLDDRINTDETPKPKKKQKDNVVTLPTKEDE